MYNTCSTQVGVQILLQFVYRLINKPVEGQKYDKNRSDLQSHSNIPKFELLNSYEFKTV